MVQQTVRVETKDHGTTVAIQKKVRVWMQVVISAIILFAGISVLISPVSYILPHQCDASTKEIAAGWIGAVIGYWLS